MSSVPEDLHVDILARLPVKSLLRCKCVCRSWFQIISNPSFVKMHHTQNKNPNLMFANCHGTDCPGIYNIGYQLLSSSRKIRISPSKIKRCYDAVKYEYPFENSHVSHNLDRRCQLFAYCNGLVYIRSWNKDCLCLWNPATKEYKILPKSPGKHMYSSQILCISAFGYDCKIDDYKVINVWQSFTDFDEKYVVDVYTLGTNSWKSSDAEIDMDPFVRKAGVLVNGALHWTSEGHRRNNKLIISLDISNEKLKGLQPPKDALERRECMMSVGALEGLLCVLDEVSKNQLEVWVMQDYGVHESWTRRYIITHEDIVKYNQYGELPLDFMWSFENGEILFWNDYKLVFYDPRHEGVRELKGRPYVRYWDAVIYCESLVPVKSGNYVGGNQEDEEINGDEE